MSDDEKNKHTFSPLKGRPIQSSSSGEKRERDREEEQTKQKQQNDTGGDQS